ncbi:P22 phage major capsid protein family protein [Chlorobium phaeobacteroides]|uniref:P22 phage major capsid protein family protein n=1 Tax=Chlorobium phaeobacteroides TaxID=1096 RepID=UPI00031A930F|nr:P22 phage major capsid protein family protein [Chlorobium phaeobacteroides]
MANNLNLYDPLFYAQEGLIQLQKALGMASRVHRGYDKEPQQKGSTIKISKPGTFTAQDAPSNDQDINAEGMEIKLDKWKEVKFG